MTEITLEVNGREITADDGDTILEACENAGIEIPTLCHHSTLSDVGACRMCSVEIEGSGFETACTTPAQDGLVVKTDTEELREHRRRILELICAEENHYCMYCDMDGDCELQDLFKEYDLDHVRIPFSYRSFPVDAVSDHLIIDHNRCILCGRCIRVCEEVVSNDTLDFGGRGQDTKVVADLNQPIGESTCISCGACQQVCPTGTILSKHSVYKGNTRECESQETTCLNCSIGCETEVFTRSNNLVQIQGTETEGASGGQLCEKGRYRPLMEDRERVLSPSSNGDGQREELELEEALGRARDMLKNAGSINAFASSRLPTELLQGFERTLKDMGATLDVVGAAEDRAENAALEQSGLDESLFADSVADLLSSDSVLAYDSTMVETHPVLSAYLRKASKGPGSLSVVDCGENCFDRYSTSYLELSSPEEELTATLVEAVEKGATEAADLDEKLSGLSVNGEEAANAIGELLEEDETYVVIGQEVANSEDLKSIFKLASLTDSKVVNLTSVSNRGALQLDHGELEESPELAYLLASDDQELEQMISVAESADQVIVQAARMSELTALADLVLPSPAWFEMEGTFQDLEGGSKVVQAPLESKLSFPSALDLIEGLASGTITQTQKAG
ncbi:MAG: 2Fe-2S iron-sulfur cluster-binding protein [Candidatus Acetothermia bacterium]